MTSWTWIALGLVLAAIELATPGGFFVIFFGVGAVAVGLLRLMGLLEQPWAQWLAFSVLAVGALRLFRQPLLARLEPSNKEAVDSIVGDTATPTHHMAAGGRGKAEVRGALWNAHNVGDRAVGTHDRCRVVAVHGLELDIQAE